MTGTTHVSACPDDAVRTSVLCLQDLVASGPIPWASYSSACYIAEQVSHHPPGVAPTHSDYTHYSTTRTHTHTHTHTHCSTLYCSDPMSMCVLILGSSECLLCRVPSHRCLCAGLTADQAQVHGAVSEHCQHWQCVHYHTKAGRGVHHEHP